MGNYNQAAPSFPPSAFVGWLETVDTSLNMFHIKTTSDCVLLEDKFKKRRILVKQIYV